MTEFEKMLERLITAVELTTILAGGDTQAAIENSNRISDIKASLVAMYTAKTANAWHLRPRQATTRDGKAVGDVPEDNELVLVCDGNDWIMALFKEEMQGVYHDPIDRNFGGCCCDWSEVQFWYSLPTITTDADGNMKLPF